MTMTRGRMVVLCGVTLYVAVMSFAGGVMSERVRFDRQRAAVLHGYDEAVSQWHEFHMSAERRAAADGSRVQVVR